MTYRDEDSAKQARVDALQDEVERLRQENEALRTQQPAAAGKKASSKKRNTRAASSRTDAETRAVDAAVAEAVTRRAQSRVVTPSVGFGLWQALGGMTLLALPCAAMMALGRNVPDFPRGPAAMLGIVLGAPLVATSLYRVIFPHVPILWKGETGEYETITRTPARRRLYLALSILVYIAGTALLLTGRR